MTRVQSPKWNRSRVLCALAVCLALALAGCTATPVIPLLPLPPAPVATGPVALPTELVAYEAAQGEVTIGSLSSQTGVHTLGPFAVEGERLAVYVDCIGVGEVIIRISGVGRFNNPCNRRVGGMGTRNEFDMRFVTSYSITVSASEEQMWALTATRPDDQTID